MATLVIAEFSIKEQYVEQFKELLASSDGLEDRRDVTLKALPAAFTADLDWLARFEREAKALASLNHPNIGGMAHAPTVSVSRASRETGPSPPLVGAATRTGVGF